VHQLAHWEVDEERADQEQVQQEHRIELGRHHGGEVRAGAQQGAYRHQIDPGEVAHRQAGDPDGREEPEREVVGGERDVPQPREQEASGEEPRDRDQQGDPGEVQRGVPSSSQASAAARAASQVGTGVAKSRVAEGDHGERAVKERGESQSHGSRAAPSPRARGHGGCAPQQGAEEETSTSRRAATSPAPRGLPRRRGRSHGKKPAAGRDGDAEGPRARIHRATRSVTPTTRA
jgi:hypothetical protein